MVEKETSGSLSKATVKMSLFDLDHTLIKGNSSFYFGLYLYRQGFLSTIKMLPLAAAYGLHKVAHMPLVKLHEKIFKRLFQGRGLSVFEELAEEFLNTHLDQLLYQPALQRLLQAQSRGDFTAILSNSPSFLVAKIARRLKVNTWQASLYGVDENGLFKNIEKILEGENKASWALNCALALNIPNQFITAYSDSFLDLPFLLCAGTAVLVNPDRKLRLLNKTHSWEIL